MVSNELIILKKALEQDKNVRFPHLNASNHFEIFVTEQILKNYELSDDEIDMGITGGGNDGGIDSWFTLVNGQLLFEDTDLTAYKKAITVDVFIMQTKRSESFEGSALDKLTVTLKELLDLDKDIITLKPYYDTKLLLAVDIFRRAYNQLASKFPNVNVTIIYATMGDIEQVHANVSRKAELLEKDVEKLIHRCNPQVLFSGAKELLDLARKNPSSTIPLRFSAYIVEKDAYLCLINLSDYCTFIVDEKGNLRKNIFETNVRDYQGNVTVNKDIEKTLRTKTEEDFWWLNNGVTIIAANATISGKTISLEDPQIVNGLQTSTEIYNYFKDSSPLEEWRSVLVKIVVTTSSTSQEYIIRATNSQTAVSLASLRATDKIQRDIEEYFHQNDLFYDRRKNYYKNHNVQRDSIVSISYLAQAILALVMQEPNQARARPSSILKDDTDYLKIFNPNYPLSLYLKSIKIIRLTDHFIKSDKNLATTEEKNNLRFHFAFYLTFSIIGHISSKRDKTIEEFVNIDLNGIDQTLLGQIWKQTIDLFRTYQTLNKTVSPDSAGKSKEFVKFLIQNFSGYHKGT